MSQFTLNINAYVGTDPGATGTALAVTAMSDFSDATYVYRDMTHNPMAFELNSVTKPAGSMTKSIRANLRAAAHTGGSCRFGFYLNSPANYKNTSEALNNVVGSTATDVFGPTSTELGNMTQAAIDQLRFVCQAVSPTVGGVRFIRGDVLITFADMPVTTIIGPTGTVTAAHQTVSWQHTNGVDGGPQAWYEVKVFTAAQYNGAGFNPDTTSPLIQSGPWASSATSSPAVELPAGVVRIYVRTAENINGAAHYAAWDFETVTVSLTTSEALTVTPVPNNTTGAVTTTVTRNTATDAWHHVELQRSVDVDKFAPIGSFTTGTAGIGTGWEAYSFGTPTVTSRSLVVDPGAHGQYQRLTATTDNSSSFGISPTHDADGLNGGYVPVAPGDVVEVSHDIKGTFTATARWNLMTWFVDAAFATTIADLRTQHTPVTSATWQHRLYHTAVAPAGSAWVWVAPELTASTSTPVAATADIDEFRVTVNGQWVNVRDVVSVLPAASTGTWDDHDLEPSVPARYRARAVKADGTVGARWIEQIGTTQWTASKVHYKVPGHPDENVALDWSAVWPQPSRAVDQDVVYPLADDDVDEVLAFTSQEPRHGRECEHRIRTSTAAQADGLIAVMRRPVILIHAPPSLRFPPGYFSPGNLDEVRLSDSLRSTKMDWTVPLVEVPAPAS